MWHLAQFTPSLNVIHTRATSRALPLTLAREISAKWSVETTWSVMVLSVTIRSPPSHARSRLPWDSSNLGLSALASPPPTPSSERPLFWLEGGVSASAVLSLRPLAADSAVHESFCLWSNPERLVDWKNIMSI